MWSKTTPCASAGRRGHQQSERRLDEGTKGNPLFPADRPILLFLDELPSASIPVMAVHYQLMNKRRAGEHKLVDNVRIVCAGNRGDDRGVMNRMPLRLCNRLSWFESGLGREQLGSVHDGQVRRGRRAVHRLFPLPSRSPRHQGLLKPRSRAPSSFDEIDSLPTKNAEPFLQSKPARRPLSPQSRHVSPEWMVWTAPFG